MLDLKAQSQLVNATADMMRSCITVATRTFAATAWQGLSLWSDMLGATGSPRRGTAAYARPMAGPAGNSLWPSPANWLAMPQAAGWSAWPWLPGDFARFGDMPWTPFVRTWWLGPSFTAWAPLADWTAWSAASFQAWNSWLDQAPLPPTTVSSSAARHAPRPGFASYRSADGHAFAQVVTPPIWWGTPPRPC